VPFSCAARPPLRAISRCFSAFIDAKPRFRVLLAVLVEVSVAMGRFLSTFCLRTNFPPRDRAPASSHGGSEPTQARSHKDRGGTEGGGNSSRFCLRNGRLQRMCRLGLPELSVFRQGFA